MHLPAASRPTRVRRLLAVSAAAAFVMIGPTACDYGAYSGGGGSSDGYAAGGHAGHADGDNVVPVGNTSPATDEEESRRDRWQNAYVRNGGGDDDGGGDGGNEQPAATTTAAEPAPDGTAAPAEPVGQDGTAAPEAPAATGTAAPTESAAATATAAPADPNGRAAVAAGGENRDNNGLDVLGRDCANSNLELHTGFQVADPTCVETSMGEVAAEDRLPSLLITEAPDQVAVGQAFELQVSTRNLVRDRFLGAAAGGYYLEASFLDGDGLQRGHFHTACRILPATNEAPDSSGAPEFFVATQDNGGGAAPDTVTIQVPGIDTAGELQCTSWAGDGSHRTPMMSRANQTPAIDSVRITVGGNGQAGQENGNAAGGVAQSEVPQPGAEAGQGQEGAGQAEENGGQNAGTAENEGGNNDGGESAEPTSAETSDADVAEVSVDETAETAEAAASTAGAGSTN